MHHESTIGLLFHWTAICLGLIYIISESVIFMPIRLAFARGSAFRTALIYCPACTGFWVGAVLGPGLWPFSYNYSPLWDFVRVCLESGIAGIVIGAIWGTWHNSVAFDTEAPLLVDDDSAPEDASADGDDAGSDGEDGEA
jgi:hypothetical protein